ncbi:hypothetical protein HYV82_06280, partial [Candidatus Woesearchaeota archaeon]|nr:hypothetical protein [Candidatus Woesearchaeota archaeon]
MAGNESFFQKLLDKPAKAETGIHELKDYSEGSPDSLSDWEKRPWEELGVGDFHPFAVIKFKGVFDLQRLYKMMVMWLKKRKYEFHETLYRFKPPELILNWRAERKTTPFVKDVITVNIDVRGFEDVETIVGGVKRKLTKGRLTLNLNFGLETGYADITGQKRWNSGIERRLRKF